MFANVFAPPQVLPGAPAFRSARCASSRAAAETLLRQRRSASRAHRARCRAKWYRVSARD